ncbi:MAG: RagB/SusD family nutrient uptake outer membrane protein [Candidatus Amulumruptor caecigallinarius]|nr:RagB/SusD family nutrient uptake outer membrane protein [Candidatus Amulumruptor caecigallinarius]
MKTINKIASALGVAAVAFGFSSCVSDLDLDPNNPNDITNVSDNIDEVFANLFFNFATYGPNGDTPVKGFDGGMASFQRAVFIAEELPTDEACWLWDPGDYGTINYGQITADLNCAYGFYSRLTVNVSLCNQFIQSFNNGTFNVDVNDAKYQDYVRQAKILRSGCYYYLMSLYNNPPYADETSAIGAEFSQPGRAAVYENVTSCLEEIVAYYKQNPSNTVYGYVGLDAAEAILAKIYLNGEVFANRADYDKCYAHSKAIIDRLGHGGMDGTGLAEWYPGLFAANNDKYVVGHPGSNVNEIIWTIPQNVPNLTSYSGATFLICGWIGTNGVEFTVGKPTSVRYDDPLEYVRRNEKYYAPEDLAKAEEEYAKVVKENEWKTIVSECKYNVNYSFDPKAVGYVSQDWFNANNGWKCMVARKSFVRKFEWNDVEMTSSPDIRTHHWLTYKYGFTVDNISLVGDDWGKNGYLAPKYSNWAYNDDGSIDYAGSADNQIPCGGDYAVIRLAEVYLMAAESTLKGGGGSQAEALQYVNNIRKRAYRENYTPWTSLSMNDLQEERCRELYGENNRRTDLIRWGMWTNGYTWDWKGGIKAGMNLPEYTKSYPIPSRVITSSTLKQIEGYN